MPIYLQVVLSATLVLGITGLAFGLLLAFASKVFFVKEDKRKEQILECLPGANCGGCGYAGCGAYVDAILSGEASTALCNACSKEAVKQISVIAGVEAKLAEQKVAYVHCGGCEDVAKIKYLYQGIADCRAAARLHNGNLECRYGCIGLGSCTKVCAYNAIKLERGVAIVDARNCVGCGKCISVCPKNLIDLIPATAQYIVKCSSQDKGATTKKVCSAGCIGCKICEKNCPADAVKVLNNVAMIDYQLCTDCGLCAQKCPTNAIWGDQN